MREILIVADDLSGAADCAIGCTLAGLETIVLLEPSPAVSEGAAAVAVDVDTRNMSPENAGRALADTIRRLHDPSTRVIYHKIHSTLRGNWASELKHARQAVGEMLGQPPLAVVAPAFPAHGRTVTGGQVHVRGVPLADTQMWKATGLTDAGDIPAPLRRTGLAPARLELGSVREGPGALAMSFRALAGSGNDVVACDAETDQDLAWIAHGLLSARVPALWVGSAGLMRQLARALSDGRPIGAAVPVRTLGSLLFVIGSASTVSHAQFERLIEDPDMMPIRIAPDLPSSDRGGAADELARRLRSAADAGKDVAMLFERGNSIDPGHSAALLSLLASVTAPSLRRFSGLVATGGETARAVLQAAGIAGIRLGGEVEPGVPWGTTVGDTVISVVTKAGAFGDSGTLVRARHALKRLTAGQDPGTATSVQ